MPCFRASCLLFLAFSISLATPLCGQLVEGGGMVVAQNALAAEIGADVLARGGHAVDAAIATAFAMAVTHPTAGNIGGGGFLLYRGIDGEETSFDFRERAPAAATRDMFLDVHGNYDAHKHHLSHAAVGVPGTVAGLWLAHRRFGKRPWSELVAPAVALARDGFRVTAHLSESLAGVRDEMLAYPASMRAFFAEDGSAHAPGAILRQPDLARTLARIRDRGADGFYRGETAGLIAAEMKRGGGIITEKDLAAYRAVERKPVAGSYRGYRVLGMAPPSSGGTTLIAMLNQLECFPPERDPQRRLHLLAEVMRRAYAERARLLGDPESIDTKAVAELRTKGRGRELAKSIDRRRASRSRLAGFRWEPESEETTHFSVVDGAGNAVALTYTLEYAYGSRIVVDGGGFLLNNEMGDFNPVPGLTDERGLIGSSPNLVGPGKRMLSSMSPTILIDRRGRPAAILGSPGGRTIINTVLQVLTGMVDLDLGAQAAVDAGRIHHQWFPDRITIEKSLATPAMRAALEGLGHKLRVRSSMGAAEIIRLRPKGKGLRAEAGVDPRGPDAGAARPSRIR
jgi:gamma-glutamyltranspeptidase / glutathione hydrolase